MQLQLPLWRPQAARDAANAVRAGLLPRRTPGGWHSRDAAVMGTAIHVELWADRRADADTAIDAVMAEMHRIDATYSPHKPDSELSRINRDAGRHAVPVSEETYALLARAQAFAELSGGAFDISYAAVGRLYDYRRGIAPDDTTLAAAPLGDPGTAVVLGRPGGPQFRPSEVVRLGYLAGIVATLVR